MFKQFYNTYFNKLYSNALKQDKGKAVYAGHCMDGCESQNLKKGEKIREQVKALKEKRRNLRDRLNKITEYTILGNDRYFSMRKKVRMQQFLFWVLVIAELGLNYFTTLIFLSADGLLFFLIRIFIAITVTALAIIATEKFLEEAIPKNKNHNKSISTIIFWALLLVGIEVAIYYFGLVRGHDFESGAIGSEISSALVLITMIIPIVAGGVRWDLLGNIDIYKNRRMYDKLKQKINSTTTKIELLIEKENTYFQKECSDYWHTLRIFCAHKNLYNKSHDIPEETLDKHKYASDLDNFKKEAEKRYNAMINKSDSKRVSSKLDNVESTPGKKLRP
jgi:hypothetical protein